MLNAVKLTCQRFMLPVLGEYVDSGFRTPRDRILYSLRSNGRYQLTYLGCGTLGLVYVFWQNGFKGTSVKALVVALAYCWGLIQAIFLMGHGLVAVPRKLFHSSDVGKRLRRIQVEAPRIHEKMEDALVEVSELESQVAQLRKRKTGISRDHQEWVEELADQSSESLSPSQQSARGLSGAANPAIITDRYLADLSRRLIRARHKHARFVEAWKSLLQDAVRTQAILDSLASKKLDFGKPSLNASLLERVTLLTPYSRYVLHARIVPTLRTVHASFFSLASICVVWSEVFKYIAPKVSIISYTVIHHRQSENGKVGFAGQVIASLWILYMCMAALAAITDLKVWGNRALVRRNTYGESACWYASQVAKLTVPLSYNFITFLPKEVYEETTFYHFLGRLINLTPLGKGFDYFFPILILVPVCATLFNLYGKIKDIFGFGVLEDDERANPSGYGTGSWREGRDLIDRDLGGRSEIENSTLLGRPHSPRASEPPASLLSREQTPRDPERGLRVHSPPVPSGGRAGTAQRQAQRLSAATQAAEEEDENVFSGFAHRIKNTIDNVERPEWFSDLTKRPKWMGGIDGDESSGRAESGRGLGRWFGGRPADGRVRL